MPETPKFYKSLLSRIYCMIGNPTNFGQNFPTCNECNFCTIQPTLVQSNQMADRFGGKTPKAGEECLNGNGIHLHPANKSFPGFLPLPF